MVDPFAARSGRVAAVARRLRCTEGQLYSMVIGALLLWMVSANALPHVVWDRDEGAARFAAPGMTTNRSSTPAPRPAGLLPAPFVEPVVSPLSLPPGETMQSGTATPPPSAPAPPRRVEPLTITSAGWASAAARSPLATVGVPDGSVPVTRRGGQPFNVAYLRLSGRGGHLELAVDGSGASTPAALAGIDLCVVTDDSWDVGRGDTALDDAPDYDCGQPVAGVPSPNGDRWTFDLSGLDTGSLTGVALVPAGDFPEFQVVLRTEEES